MQNTIGSHEPALVSPQDFLDRMMHLWSEPPFNMPTSWSPKAGAQVTRVRYYLCPLKLPSSLRASQACPEIS